MLPEIDMEYLKARMPEHSLSSDGGMICVVIPNYPVPPGYKVTKADLLLRLQPTYPDVPPDMWWFDPPLQRKDGVEIAATQAIETHLGRQWQRWSRHLTPGQWQSGTDTLASYFTLIRKELLVATPVSV